MKRTVEYFSDFYGFTYSVIQQANGSYRLCARDGHGDLYHVKTYSSRRGCNIALGKLTEGTARPTGKREVD